MKIEKDVQGDNYSKISWELFAGTLFWWFMEGIFYTATVAERCG